MSNQTAQFNGEAGNIESNVNKVDTFSEDISEEAAKQKYPSVKCLKNIPRIIESGTSGIWTYRKWNSGMYEAWFTNLEVETTDYTASGSVFVSQKLYSFTAPFNTLSTCVGTASSSHTYSWGAIWHSNQTINVKILAVSAGTSKGRVDLYITGTWK